MIPTRLLALLGLSFATLLTHAAAQEARLAHVFQDKMILQRDKPVPVWGWASAGTKVSVAFAGQEKQATAGENGIWKTDLDPMSASAEARPFEVTMGKTTVTRNDVLVGEVWIAAGQSNMVHTGPDKPNGFNPHYTSPGTEGGLPPIHTIRFGNGVSLEPLDDVVSFARGDAPWTVVQEPIEDGNMAYYFARVVRDALKVPVGIVHVAVSGTNQTAWMSRETLEEFPGQGEYKNFYDEFLATFEAKLAKGGDIRSWEDFQRAENEWLQTRKGPWPGRGQTLVNFPTALYNTRIHPLAPYAVRGVIWHQGEGGPGGAYGERLVAMINQWRKLFGQDFAFIWGTLTRETSGSPPLEPKPAWFYRSSTNLSSREAMQLFGENGNATLVELYDIGDQDTHFLQKAEAGRRMGLAALDLVYDQDQVYSGPLLADLQVEGAKATATWNRVGEGLRYLPSIDGISGFYLKGGGENYHWAEVELVGSDKVVLSHPEVATITAVGYAVDPNPHETLSNSAGYPASPFRWKMDRIPWSGHSEGGLITLQSDQKVKAGYNLAHVRREGYVFQFPKTRKTPDDLNLEIEAYLPAEWAEPTVLVGGEEINFKKVDRDGQSFAAFTAPADGTWVVVAEKSQAKTLSATQRY